MQKIDVYFEKMSQARKAVEKLKSMGYRNAYLDINDRNQTEFSAEINPAGSQNAMSLSSLVLKSKGFRNDASKGPLMASNPMVSGIGPVDDMADPGARLSVSVEDENAGIIRKLLMDMGGTD